MNKPKRPRDIAQLAYTIAGIATGTLTEELPAEDTLRGLMFFWWCGFVAFALGWMDPVFQKLWKERKEARRS